MSYAMNLNATKQYVPLVLRIGLSFVFLWFGVNQVIDPIAFQSYVPELVYTEDGLHIDAVRVVLLNGIFEIVLGLLLIAGLFTRVTALIMGLHLISIIIALGYNEIAIRDVGLLCITIALVLHGPDRFSLDAKIRSKT